MYVCIYVCLYVQFEIKTCLTTTSRERERAVVSHQPRFHNSTSVYSRTVSRARPISLPAEINYGLHVFHHWQNAAQPRRASAARMFETHVGLVIGSCQRSSSSQPIIARVVSYNLSKSLRLSKHASSPLCNSNHFIETTRQQVDREVNREQNFNPSSSIVAHEKSRHNRFVRRTP
jgi:hypothetical protein